MRPVTANAGFAVAEKSPDSRIGPSGETPNAGRSGPNASPQSVAWQVGDDKGRLWATKAARTRTTVQCATRGADGSAMPKGLAVYSLILAYRGCILFEVIEAASLLEPQLPVRVATPDGGTFRDRSGLTVLPDLSYDTVCVRQVGCLLVPGGNPDSIATDERTMRIVREVAARDAVVAGICAGVAVLGLAGVLRGRRVTHNYTAADVPAEVRRHTDPLWAGTTHVPCGIAVDGRLITARPEHHAAFAAAVAAACGAVAGDT